MFNTTFEHAMFKIPCSVMVYIVTGSGATVVNQLDKNACSYGATFHEEKTNNKHVYYLHIGT